MPKYWMSIILSAEFESSDNRAIRALSKKGLARFATSFVNDNRNFEVWWYRLNSVTRDNLRVSRNVNIVVGQNVFETHEIWAKNGDELEKVISEMPGDKDTEDNNG